MADTPADSGVISPIPQSEHKLASADQEDDGPSSGSEQSDDPHDETFKATSRRKDAIPKLTADRGRKRKLSGSAPRAKRPRTSAEGDDLADITAVDGSSDCAPMIPRGPREHRVAGFMSTKMPIPRAGEPFENSYGPSPPPSSSQNFS